MPWLCPAGTPTRIYTSKVQGAVFPHGDFFFISMTKLELFWFLWILSVFPS